MDTVLARMYTALRQLHGCHHPFAFALLMQTLLMEMEGKAAADRQQLAALRAEVERMEGLAANRLKAADADKHVQEDTTW